MARTKKATTSKKRSKFVYKAPTADQMKKRAEQTGGNFEGIFKNDISLYKIKGGENCIRILPPTWDEHEHCGYEVFVHSFIGPSNGTYLCLAKMRNEHCPICEASADAKRSGDQDEAYALQARKRVIFWVIDRDSENEGPLLFDAGWQMDRDIFALTIQKRSGKVRLVDHPDKGHDILFKRQGEGIKTRYFGYQIEPEESPIFEDDGEQDNVLEFIQENPIPELLVFREADHLEKVLSGTSSSDDEGSDDVDDDDDEDEDEAPRKKKASSKSTPSKKRRKVEEEDDDEDEDTDDDEDEDFDDDEEDEDEDTDDDVDEDDDDEDEEPEPKKKRAPSKRSSASAKEPPKKRQSARAKRFGR